MNQILDLQATPAVSPNDNPFVEDWSTMSNGCNSVTSNEWSTVSNGCTKDQLVAN